MFRAEWQKITGNRLIAALFVWIFPLAVTMISALILFVALFSADLREGIRISGVYKWDEALLIPWMVVNNELGRFVVVAFMGFVFAGEYQHGTWKNLVLYRSRIQLILTKFFTVVLMVTFAWVLMSVIHMLFQGILAVWFGLDFGSFDQAIVERFIKYYSLEVFTTVATTFIAAGYAAAAAILVKNLMTSVFIGIVLNLAETGTLLFAFIIDGILNINIFGLYQFTPSYNIINIRQWVASGEGYTLQLGDMNAPIVLNAFSMPISLIIAGMWFAALIGFAVWRFHRQDITT